MKRDYYMVHLIFSKLVGTIHAIYVSPSQGDKTNMDIISLVRDRLNDWRLRDNFRAVRKTGEKVFHFLQGKMALLTAVSWFGDANGSRYSSHPSSWVTKLARLQIDPTL
jgi:hypothetical protein